MYDSYPELGVTLSARFAQLQAPSDMTWPEKCPWGKTHNMSQHDKVWYCGWLRNPEITPPKQPWFLMIPLFSNTFKVVQDFVHPQYDAGVIM